MYSYNIKRKVDEPGKRNLWQEFEVRMAAFRKIKQTNSWLFFQLLPFLLCVPVTGTSGFIPSRKSSQKMAARVYKYSYTNQQVSHCLLITLSAVFSCYLYIMTQS